MTSERIDLLSPPIFEVVCGFIFKKIDLSNPFLLSDYVATQAAKGFERIKIARTIEDSNSGINIRLGEPQGVGQPYRIWLESRDSKNVIQIQDDKFYFNWKRVLADTAYPSFSGANGIREIALIAYNEFRNYVRENLGQDIQCTRVDLAKYDHFERKTTPDDLSRIAPLIPMLNPLAVIQSGGTSREANNCNIAIGFSEIDGNSRLTVNLNSGFYAPTPTQRFPIYRLETIINTDISSPDLIESTLTENNLKLRKVFMSILDEDQMKAVFGVKPS